jgi:hypothetical protein
MKPFQIAYNIVNNQIADILVDEIGSVIMLDQNTLPQHSLGEDWGKGNLAKAYVAMKDFGMLPLDTSITNTENALNFQHFQVLNLEQTQRMLSRIQLATYFKQQAFEVIGITPQRLGQQLGQTNTATGIEQAIAGSYAQTENYFTQHSDHLMPRVHQMRTDLAQYYASNNPSIRMKASTSNDERINFEINGTDLLMRDINVFCSTKANHRTIIEQMKQLAISNNTSGASIYDLGHILQTDSMGHLNNILKDIENKQKQQKQEEFAQVEKMKQMEIDAQAQEKAAEREYESSEAEKNRRKDLLVAEIKSSGYGAMQDLNENKQSDFADQMETMRKTNEYQETIGFDREKEINKNNQFSQKMGLEREKMEHQTNIKQMDMDIAQENKNRFDVKSKKPSENKKK